VFVFNGRFEDARACASGTIHGIEERQKAALEEHWVPIADGHRGKGQAASRAHRAFARPAMFMAFAVAFDWDGTL